ncbi:hypothetical protein MPSEU_000757100 [Mayamaea pseudoterrestris]|nr:hypothetical protein MPSEU_000757100 [Mayamaea pseudoterrestris]
MPKASTSTKKKTLVAKGERKQPRRKTVPLYLTLPDEKANSAASRVWLATANLETIQVAARQKRPPVTGRLTFYTLTSPTERLKTLQIASYAIQLAEERVLPLYGGRPWSCHVVIKDNPKAWYIFDAKGRVQPATLPHLLPYNTIQKKAWNGKKNATPSMRGCATSAPPKFPKFHDARADVCSDDEYDVIAHLPSAAAITSTDCLDRMRDWILDDGCQMTTLSNLAWTTDAETRRLNVSIKWTSPLGLTFRTRTAAHAEAQVLCKRQATLDRVILGITPAGKPVPLKPVGKRQGLTSGKWRFERDGLWVVGQEDEWRVKRLLEQYGGIGPGEAETSSAAAADLVNSMSPLAYYIHCNRKSHQSLRLRELKLQAERESASEAIANSVHLTINAAYTHVDKCEATMESEASESSGVSLPQAIQVSSSVVLKKASSQVKISFTIREAETELRTMWKQLSDEERQQWSNQVKCLSLTGETTSLGDTSNVTEPVKGILATTAIDESILFEETGNRESRSMELGTLLVEPVAISIPTTPTTSDSLDAMISAAKVSPSPVPDETSTSATLSHKDHSEEIMFRLPPQVSKHIDRASWRLDQEQIKLCYDAGMEHYDQVMRTVQLRDLHRELQDGFDVLRERGRGRYDMELPAFDEPVFDFITDLKKAPWMPIVREILGKNVMLIHKGMFLSMPGALPQPYHQDGLHLNQQYQKPCHAINVFVPLIDMTMQHGPTEFCLGSHILGKEDLRREFCVTPVVPAGTPVIFDYRLGHRGLGNTANTCRPIVYCTYACAADGKEFRDSVNFSRKRYRKLGDIVCNELTRDERAKKRRLQFDEILDAAGIASCSADPSLTVDQLL